MTPDYAWLWLLFALAPYIALSLRWQGTLASFRPGDREWASMVARRRRSMAAGAAFWACGVLAVSGISGSVRQVPERVGDAVVTVVLDASNSMLSRATGGGSRLDESLRLVRALTASVPPVRWRLVAFEGRAMTLCPATYDLAAFDESLAWVGPALSDAPGSDLGAALAEVRTREDGSSSSVVLVLSDGNDTGGNARLEAGRLGASGARLVFVGAGGQPEPVANEAGLPVLDHEGRQFSLGLAEAAMNDWARASRGSFVRLDDPAAFQTLADVIEEAARGAGSWRNVPRKTDGAPTMAVLAALALALAAFFDLPQRRAGRRR
ncbi:MAG: VWA domain-containing protein [Spirochaetales bacterium]|nr:VWA domain-containing protein [Spirochaetales bacterium]MBP7263918.1 VWA domain-containing protein [Spirochaetia bacterium]